MGADIFMFDEPSSYLDVKQRLNAAVAIRNLIAATKYVIVVEHDLAVLDYLSDYICCLYGVPGAYGVVTMPASVRDGINIFLEGFIPTENLRFREEALVFKDSEILVMLGENGTGKTTFIRMMAGKLEPDSGSGDIPSLNISYKPQKITPRHQGTVQMLLHE